MSRRILQSTIWLLTGVAALLLSGCVLAPKGTSEEQSRVNAAGKSYEQPAEKRTLPELSPEATWQEALQRAFLANGDLEAAYFEWKAAMTRIDQAASWPNSNVAVSYSYMFSSGNMKAWDRSTIGVGFDPSMNLQLPIKAQQAGKVALQDARAAGYRFATLKFDLQRRVFLAYYDLTLAEERIRIQRDNVSLLNVLSQTAQARVQAGAPEQDLLKIQIELRLSENDLHNIEAEARGTRAMLNGLLAREPESLLPLPQALPAPRAAEADDARLIALGVEQNPELAAFAAQVVGRQDALELARLRYIPDINPSFAFTGSVSQAAGAMLMLPTNLPSIRGAVNEALATLRSGEATLRQAKRDRASLFVATLYFLRNAERQADLFQQRVLPLAQQAMNSSRQAYAAGNVGFADLIDSQRLLLDVRLLTVQVRIEREKRLAELEALTGTDIETLARPATQPTSRPMPEQEPR